ncbi:MAG: GT-D fold domain-containing glycosyltransferase [Blautia sp.]
MILRVEKSKLNIQKKIWNGRNIILVEGRKTRFGIGNDLLNNVKSISRILGSSESAFDYMSELIYACESECKKISGSISFDGSWTYSYCNGMEITAKGNTGHRYRTS